MSRSRQQIFATAPLRGAVTLLVRTSLALATLAGCRAAENKVPAHASPDAAAAAASAPEQPPAYPRGRWRLISASELSNTVLWLSHILIRDRESVREAPFLIGDPWPVPAAPNRTPEQALAMALAVMHSARADSARFAELARATSEDMATRELGGVLGGLPASQFLSETQILDACAQLRPGEVSAPIHTKYGYHVLLREPPPPAAWLSGRRVTIAYGVGGRTPEATVALAQQLRETLAADTSADIRVLSSDAREEATGTWSSREPAELSRELALLARAQIGTATPLIPTPNGVSFVLRTPPSGAEPIPVQLLRLPYETSAAPRASTSRASVHALASSILATLARDPSQFEALRERHCCASDQLWGEVRSPTALHQVAATLAPGETARHLLDADHHLQIVRRADGPLEFALELPSPALADLYAAALNWRGSRVQSFLVGFGSKMSSELALPAGTAGRLTALHAELASAFAIDKQRPERERAVNAFRRRLGKLLTAEQQARYVSTLRAQVSDMLMATR